MRLCELTELCEGCVECTELLKANDHILLSLGTFVHVLSEHSVLCLVFFLYFDCISSPRMQKKLLLLIVVIDCIPRDSQSQYLIKCMGDQRRRCATILIWRWEALAGSAICHILSHRRL